MYLVSLNCFQGRDNDRQYVVQLSHPVLGHGVSGEPKLLSGQG